MRNILPMIVGAVVVGGGAIAIYNALGGRNDPLLHAPPPVTEMSAEVSPTSVGTDTAAPKPATTFSKVEIASDETILGKTDAPVTIVEYASMTCPHCAEFHNTVLPIIKTEFIDKGQVRLVFRDFPLDNLALAASVVARCAGPERYYPFINALFASQSKWAGDPNPMIALSRIARLGGMSQVKFESCLKQKNISEKVLAQRLEADKIYGLRTTPTIIVNGDLYSGGLGIDQLRAVINAKLK